MPTSPLSHIEQQIKAARADLDKYQPDGADWLKKSLAATRSLLPWLTDHAPAMKQYVEGVLNAPVKLRSLWQEIRGKVNLPPAKIAEFDRQLTLDDVMRESLTGEVVSKVITRFLKETHGGLAENSRSDYPDIFMTGTDYGFLPKFARGANQNYGAALKKDKPVRVPDGLEIKTCRNRVAVDCHYPHAGLHLVLLFTEKDRLFVVKELLVAFLQSSDYRRSNESTDATTRKFSINGDRFVSLFA